MKLQQLDHIAITVTDIERTIEWYTRVLGLVHRRVVEGEYPQFICAGDTCLALFPASGNSARRLSDDERAASLTMRHFAFRTDGAGFKAAQAGFREQGIEYRFADYTTAHSLYITDPDGYTVEVTTYEV